MVWRLGRFAVKTRGMKKSFHARIVSKITTVAMAGLASGTMIVETIRAWNDFFMPLVFTANRPSLQTIAVGLYTQFTNRNTADLATMAAGIVIAFIPVVVVFIVLQKYFVEGIAGAVKN